MKGNTNSNTIFLQEILSNNFFMTPLTERTWDFKNDVLCDTLEHACMYGIWDVFGNAVATSKSVGKRGYVISIKSDYRLPTEVLMSPLVVVILYLKHRSSLSVQVCGTIDVVLN